MKFLILACLLGYAAASFLQRATSAVDDNVNAFLDGMSRAGSLRAALDMPEAFELDTAEDDIKTELGKKLKEHLDAILEKIKDAIDHGKTVKEEYLTKLKELKEKLKDLKLDIGEKAKELIGKIKEKGKDFLKKILDILGIGGGEERRSLDNLIDEIKRFSIKDLVERIKEKIVSNENIQKIREYIKNFVSENPVIQRFKEFIAKLRDVDLKELIKSLFDCPSNRNVRSLKEMWEKVKEYFKDLHIDIKEHFVKFGEWVKTTFKQGLEKIKDKHERIKEIAKQFKEHIKDVSAEVAREGLEFLRPYKEDLGSLWNQIVEMVKEQIGKSEY